MTDQQGYFIEDLTVGMAEEVSNVVTEAMIEQGFEMVPASDVQLAFENNGMLIPRLEPKPAAEFTAKEFGASGVLLGEVLRYRDRVDDAMRSERGASVSFLVTLYAAPGGAKLWSAQFEETQRSITADPLRARHYPGGGTRWMSVAEFSRWGASELAEKLRLAR